MFSDFIVLKLGGGLILGFVRYYEIDSVVMIVTAMCEHCIRNSGCDSNPLSHSCIITRMKFNFLNSVSVYTVTLMMNANLTSNDERLILVLYIRFILPHV
jgi:hypothetical protein